MMPAVFPSQWIDINKMLLPPLPPRTTMWIERKDGDQGLRRYRSAIKCEEQCMNVYGGWMAMPAMVGILCTHD